MAKGANVLDCNLHSTAMRKIIACLFLFSGTALKAQKISADEEKLIAYVRKNFSANINLLKEIVDINSGTLNTEGVKKVGAVLAKKFKEIEFSTNWITLPDSMKRAGHLVAQTKGTKGKKLLLVGHLDTVFEPDMPANPFHFLNDSTATGQGVNDMKGGDIIIFAALQALYQSGFLKDRSITAYFTGDEEKSGRPVEISRRDFIEKARASDIALAFESAQGLNSVATARRGASQWQLKVYGQQAHSSGIFAGNYGAVYEASRIVNEFREQLSNEKYLTFNPAFFVGGTDITYDSSNITGTVSGKTNIISPMAIVQGDLRFLTETQKQKAREKMKVITGTNNLAGTKAVISFSEGIPAMEPTAANDSLARVLNKLSLDLGWGEVKPGDPGSRGAGDISYIASYLPCLDGLGASGRGAHAPGETINLTEFPKLVERTAILIYRLTR
jgi:glutamate carboxypeptidase